MRTSQILLRTHKGMQFKSHWLIQRKRKIPTTKAESILQSKGIDVIDAKDILRPSIIEEPYEEPSPPVSNAEPMQKYYVFKPTFIPLANVEQCQLITNSIVFPSLPESFTSKVKELSSEDKELFDGVILNSHLLDAKQKKLPYKLDVHNHPGYKPSRSYGIKTEDRIASLLHQLVLLAQRHSKIELLPMLQNVASTVTLNHSGKRIHFNYLAKMLLCSRNPIKPELESSEVKAKAGTLMPDIFPFSPFIHCKEIEYNPVDSFAVSTNYLVPHTVFMSYARLLFPTNPETFCGMSLLYAFAHAASYAKEVNKDLTGDLERPVTLNIVHTDGRRFHLGRFQLNTLDCNGDTRNFFWHQPFEFMFKKIRFENASPVVESSNAKPLALLRALF